jgi:hypothetical protein
MQQGHERLANDEGSRNVKHSRLELGRRDSREAKVDPKRQRRCAESECDQELRNCHWVTPPRSIRVVSAANC